MILSEEVCRKWWRAEHIVHNCHQTGGRLDGSIMKCDGVSRSTAVLGGWLRTTLERERRWPSIRFARALEN